MGAEGTHEKATLIVRKHGLKNGTKIMLDIPRKATRSCAIRVPVINVIGSNCCQRRTTRAQRGIGRKMVRQSHGLNKEDENV
jgi:hypothetical protein